MYNTEGPGHAMTAQDLAVWMVRENAYELRELIECRRTGDRYGQDPGQAERAWGTVDAVRKAFDFTTDEALGFVRMTTSEM